MKYKLNKHEVLEKIKSNLTREEYYEFKKAFLMADNCLGLNRVWSKENNINHGANLTTKELSLFITEYKLAHKEVLNSSREHYQGIRKLQKEFVEELQSKFGRTIDKELLEEIYFDLAIPNNL